MAARPPLVTRDPGYLFEVADDELDLLRFSGLYRSGAGAVRSANWPRARADLAQALGLWRGSALADVDSPALHRDEAARLEQMRLQAVEWRIEADLNLGDHCELAPELESLSGCHPLRERFHAQLMLALYRCGRQAEALAVYQRARRILLDELGAEPGPELSKLHERVLRGDRKLALARPISDAGRSGVERVVPRQLPAAVAHFTGRSYELKALRDLVERTNVSGGTVVISALAGMPGVGKTTLAVQWAHAVASRFPDGQLYVNLRGYAPSAVAMPPAEAIRGFLDALGVAGETIPAELPEQTALYRSLLAGQRMLIVLDNARDEQQVRPLLPGSQGCLVIVTSRSHLLGLVAAQGACPVFLDVLSATEAREFLARRLGPERVDAEPDATTELAALCARLPLALSIVAARGAVGPHDRIGSMTAELREMRLDALDSDDVAISVRAVFSWSYQNLSAAAAHAFRMLALHPGPDISLATAANLLGVTEHRARAALCELTRVSLLTERTGGRFTFHDLLRDYAAEKSQESETPATCQAAIRRLLDYYVVTARAAAMALHPAKEPIRLGPSTATRAAETFAGLEQANAWFETELRGVLAAVGLADRARFDRHVWHLGWAVTDFMCFRGYWDDWLGTQYTALRATQRLGDVSAQARVHRSLGRAHMRLRAFDKAQAHLFRALTLYKRLENLIWQGNVYLDITCLFEWQNREREALGYAYQTLRLYELAGHRIGAAYALNTIGWCHAKLGEYRETLRHCTRAIEIHNDIGNPIGQAETWDTLGYAHHHLGDQAAAVTFLEEAVWLFRSLGNRPSEAFVLGRLGDAHDAAGDSAAARAAWRQALTILDDLRHPDADRLRPKAWPDPTDPQ